MPAGYRLKDIRRLHARRIGSGYDGAPLFVSSLDMTLASDQSTGGYANALPPGAIARLGTLRWSTAGTARRIAFGPDGQIVACAPDAGPFHDTIQLWDVGTGEIRRVLRGHSDLITGVKFCRDGKRLFSSSCDKTVRCWDVSSGNELQRFHFKGPVCAVDVTADEKLMAVCVGKEVYLRDATRRKHIVRLASDEFKITDVKFSPDDRLLAAPTPFGSVTVWNVAARTQEMRLDAGRAYFRNIAFSADGRLLAAGQGVGSDARVWDVSEQKPTAVDRELWKKRDADPVAFSPTEQLLATNHGWTGLGLFDAATGELRHELVGHAAHVESLAFSPNGDTLASGAQDGTIRLWSVATGKELYHRPGHQHSVETLDFSPDGEFLVTGSADWTARVWRTRNGSEVGIFDAHHARLRDVAVSPDGQRVASRDDRNDSIRLWDLRSCAPRVELKGHQTPPSCLAFTQNGETLVSGGGVNDRVARLWSTSSGELIRNIQMGDNFEDFIHSVAISADDKLLACALDNESIRVYDVGTSELLHILEGHEAHTNWLLFLSDGQRLASASSDHTAIIWDLCSGKPEHILRGHSKWVTSVACLSDGQTLVTASGDATIRLWDLPTGRPLKVIHAHRGEINALAASKCGRYVASGSTDTTVLLWDAQQLIRDREKQDE